MSSFFISMKYQLVAPLSAILKWVSPSSEIAGPPKGYFKSTKDYMARQNAPEIIRYHKLFDAKRCIKIQPAPLTPDSIVHWRFTRNAEFNLPEQFVVEILQGRVIGGSCQIVSPDDYVIADLSRQFGINGDLDKLPILKRLRLPPVKKFNGTLGVAGFMGSNNYWHWMVDILPRVQMLKMSGWFDKCDKVLINEPLLPFQLATLRQLDLPNDKFIFSKEYLHLKADRLIVPCVPEVDDHLPLWSIKFLRSLFSVQIMQCERRAEKIYITRQRAKNRQLINEQEILEVLLPLGFKVVTLEELSVEEQVTLFASAAVIIAPHGAGQTNLIFSQPGTRVIELFSPLWVHYCFWSICPALGLDYYYVMGEGEMITEEKYTTDKGANIFVDINKFKNILDMAGVRNKSGLPVTK